MFERIVVGFDGSDMSKRALHVASDLAGKYGSELHLVHTQQPQTVAFATGAVGGYHAVTSMPPMTEVKLAGEKIQSMAEAIVAEHGLSFKSTHMEIGDPADRILKCANEQGADLIVTGRRGLGALGALVQGSTTQKVNQHAECACMSVL